MKKRHFTFFVLSLIGQMALAQDDFGANNQEDYQLNIQRTTEKILIDGDLSESVWQTADVADKFWKKWPTDKERARMQTEVRVTYDEQFIYIGATCFDSTNHVIQTLKRDVRYWSSDGLAVVLDPVNKKTYGFIFGISPMGVQMEGLLGGFDDIRTEWDNKWFGEVKRYEDRWTIEMAIPFKTLRYEEGNTSWGINFIRNDLKNNEYHTWTAVPRQFDGVDLGYTGALNWDQAPAKTKGNVAIIPFVTGSSVSDFEEGDGKMDFDGSAGLDAKVAVSSSLNLDITLNPDFSQIEVDRQVTNLTRFDIFFPERRTFFLENSDLFSSFGIPPIRPFFSRRIGLNEDRETVPILFGARLSGNLDDNWRIGLMNMHTRGDNVDLSQNYSAAAFERRLFKRSTIKGMFLNRQAVDGTDFSATDYGRNADVEFTYQNNQGNWVAWAGYHRSFQPGPSDKARFMNTGFWYNGRNVEVVTDILNMGTNYYADMGFLARIENYDAERDTTIRLGFQQFFTEVNYRIFPKENKNINFHRIGFENFLVYNPDGSFNERATNLRYRLAFTNTSNFSFRLANNELELLFPFSFTDGDPLPAKRYDNYSISLGYESDQRKVFNFEAEIEHWPGFYDGNLTSVSLDLNYRRQPWGNFSIDFEYNNLTFEAPYGETELFLIGPRMEINFTRNLFWTTFLQFNTQAENFNVNSRLQWRFAPMSDLFIVYTDNYLLETETLDGRFRFNTFAPKNRAFVFKLNYWLGI